MAAGQLRPMYDTLIGDPIHEGRLRLDGLSPMVRQVTIIGLVTLGGLLGSLLFNDLWRRGDLLHLTVSSGRFTFIPVTLFPATVLALFVGWWLVLWGAASASVPVRILAAAMFLLVNAPVGRVPLVELAAERGSLAPLVVRVGYFGAPTLLIALSVLRVRHRLAARVRPAVQAAIVGALACMFGGLLWSHVLQIRNGITPTVPFSLSDSIGNAEDLLIPLVIVSGIAVIEFSRDVAVAAAAPLWTARAGMASGLALTLIAVKLWIQLGRHLRDWSTYVVDRPASVGATVLVLAFLFGAGWFARRHAIDRQSAERSKERLIYGPALLLALPAMLLLLVKTLGDFLLTQANWLEAARVIGRIRFAEYLSDADAAAASVLLLTGVLLYARRERSPAHLETGIGLLIVGSWSTCLFVLELFNVAVGWRAPFLDILLTAGIGVYLLLRWRQIDTRGAVVIGAVVAFTWLVSTRGDFISILGGFLGLPGISIVVVGTLFALVADSSFASGDSRRFPRTSRPPLWIGYLVISATIVNWLTAAHGTDVTEAVGGRGWTYLGVPLAVWLITRLPFVRPAGAPSAPSTAPPNRREPEPLRP
jgi:hypothetical protein